MPITVSADGLSIITTKSEGTANATIPDVCKTPFPSPPGPLPLPYPNITKSETAKVTSILTRFDGGNVACFGSYTEKSEGDETGSLGGIISGKTGGKGFFLNSSATVKVEGRGVVRKSDLMITNEINTICMAGMSQADVGTPAAVQEADYGFVLKIVLKSEKTEEILPRHKFKVFDNGSLFKEGTSDKNGNAKIRVPEEKEYEIVAAFDETFTVRGKVFIRGTDKPLANTAVTVIFSDESTQQLTTGAGGRLSLENVPYGNLTVMVDESKCSLYVESDIFLAAFAVKNPDVEEDQGDVEDYEDYEESVSDESEEDSSEEQEVDEDSFTYIY